MSDKILGFECDTGHSIADCILVGAYAMLREHVSCREARMDVETHCQLARELGSRAKWANGDIVIQGPRGNIVCMCDPEHKGYIELYGSGTTLMLDVSEMLTGNKGVYTDSVSQRIAIAERIAAYRASLPPLVRPSESEGPWEVVTYTAEPQPSLSSVRPTGEGALAA